MWKDERDNKLLHCKHEHLSEFPSPSSKTKHALITPLTHVFLTSGQKTTRKFSPTPRYIHTQHIYIYIYTHTHMTFNT